jgi:peptidoglycan hydrolase CwlO-like protein
LRTRDIIIYLVVVAWTLVAVILAGMAGFFFDARTERRSIKTTIDQMRVELRSEITNVKMELRTDVQAQTARIDQTVARVDQMGPRIDEVVKDIGEIKGDIKNIKGHIGLVKTAWLALHLTCWNTSP